MKGSKYYKLVIFEGAPSNEKIYFHKNKKSAFKRIFNLLEDGYITTEISLCKIKEIDLQLKESDGQT